MMKNENTPAPPAESSRALEEAQEGLNVDELAEVIQTLKNTGHGGRNFEPECPACTALRKIEAMRDGALAAPADHLPAANGAKPVEVPSSRFVVKKEIGSEWARVIDTQTGMQVTRYNVMPRKRSTRDGWKEADNHAAKLNAAAAAVLDTQREEGK